MSSHTKHHSAIMETNIFQCLCISDCQRFPSESDRGLRCNQSVCLMLTTQISLFSFTGPSCLGFILTTVWERSVWGSSTLKSSAPLPLSPNTDGSRCSWHSMEQHLTVLIHSDTQKYTHTHADTQARAQKPRYGHIILLLSLNARKHAQRHTCALMATIHFQPLINTHTHTQSQQEHMLPRIYKSSQ